MKTELKSDAKKNAKNTFDFASDIGLNNNAANTVIGTRSFTEIRPVPLRPAGMDVLYFLKEEWGIISGEEYEEVERAIERPQICI